MTATEETRIDNEAFATFADLHPVEAFDLDHDRFCKYVQETNIIITSEQIEELINQSR
jgi:hypothetical protein